MGVVVMGMEMPKDCWHCPMINSSDECCLLTEEQHDMYEGVMDQVQAAFCPLVEIPPHGRLIDADSLKETLDYYIREAGWDEKTNQVLGWVKDEFIDSEPTIVEAEGE